MRRLVEHSRFLVLGGVAVSLVAALLAFVSAAVKLVKTVNTLVHGDPGIVLPLLQIVDVTLIGAALLTTAIGLYELFVAPLQVPEGLGGHTFDALKQKLATVVVLVMAVNFVERLETSDTSRDILASGVAIAVMSAVLIWFAREKRA